MTTNRQHFVDAFHHHADPPARRSRWLPYIAAIATVTLLAVLTVAAVLLLGGVR